MSAPLVSVIIPAFNQGRYLGEAIDSALVQTHREIEVVVVDDGSTDETPDVVCARRDIRLRYVYQENRGLSAARNTGIRETSGEWLSFLDADDVFLTEKVSMLMSEVDQHPEAGLVAGQAIPIDESGRPVGRIFDHGPPSPPQGWLLGNPLHVGSVILSRTWQGVAGSFDESLRSYEDWDLWLRLALAGCPMRWAPKPVSLYRFHGSQMIRDGRQMTEANLAVLDKFFGQPSVPAAWVALRHQAYSRAHLRAAANAYSVGDHPGGNTFLLEAIRLDPGLLEGRGWRLRDMLFAWSEFPKTSDRLAFLEGISSHLPDGLRSVFSRQDLGEATLRAGVEAYQRGDCRTARSAIWRGLRLDPSRLRNRGLVAMLVRSWGPATRRGPGEGAH